MSWAKIAVAGLSQNGPDKKYELKWHCQIDKKNRELIERLSLSMAEKYKFLDISVRAGVHNTFKRRDANGKEYTERDAPWHFTVEFKTQDGKYRNAHVYTQMQERQNAQTNAVERVAVGIAGLGGRIKKNPEVFDEQDFASHKKQVTSRTIINISVSGWTFRW